MIRFYFACVWRITCSLLLLLMLQDAFSHIRHALFSSQNQSDFFFNGLFVHAFCPGQCRCDDISLQASCSNGSLSHFPIVMNPRYKRMFLDSNVISSLNNQIEIYPGLELLDISSNKIDKINDLSFKTSHKLRELYLRGNRLSRISNLTFVGLESLLILNLDDNLLTSIDGPVFRNLTKLKRLDLTGNRLSFLSFDAFLGLAQLETLLLRNNYLSLSPSLSSSSSSLPSSFSSISVSSQLSFSKPSTSITIHSMSSAQHKEATNNSDDLKNNNTYTSSPSSREYISSSSSKISDKQTTFNLKDALNPSYLLNLVHLDLAGNYFPLIAKENSPFFNGYDKLDKNAQSNRQNQSHFWSNLTELILENCSINYIEPDSFNSITELSILRLHSNKLQQVPQDALSGFENLHELQIGSNSFTEVNSTALSSLTKLKILDISHCIYLDKIHPKAFYNLEQLEKLVLSFNLKLKHLDGHLFDKLVHLIELDLRSNSLKTLNPTMSIIGDNIKVLNLAGNQFTCNCSVQWIRNLFIKLQNNASEVVSSSSFFPYYTRDISNIVNAVICAEPMPLRNRRVVDLDEIRCFQVDSMYGVIIGLVIGCLIILGVIVICGIRWGNRPAGFIRPTAFDERSHYPPKFGAKNMNNRKIFGVVNNIPNSNLDYGNYCEPEKCIIVPDLNMKTTTIIKNLNNSQFQIRR